MLIGKEELCTLIPHTGAMCLLDGVLRWDETEILCTASSHLESGNPLRRKDRLHTVGLLEYGAQAMAAHGGLLARETNRQARPGYLAALHEVCLAQDFMDDTTLDLTIQAHRLAAANGSFMYRFTVSLADKPLASARATVMTASGKP
jgi:predicted hotdog family 3-hydroxylacyl-ACP dehydratase